MLEFVPLRLREETAWSSCNIKDKSVIKYMRVMSVQTVHHWICPQNPKSWDPNLVKKATKSVNSTLYLVH